MKTMLCDKVWNIGSYEIITSSNEFSTVYNNKGDIIGYCNHGKEIKVIKDYIKSIKNL